MVFWIVHISETYSTLSILCIPSQCVTGSFYNLHWQLSVVAAAVVSFFRRQYLSSRFVDLEGVRERPGG